MFFQDLKLRETEVDSHLLRDIVRILKRGQLLVYTYTQACGFETMCAAGVDQGSFVTIYVELGDCIQTIYEDIEGGVIEMFHYPIDFDAVAPIYFLDEDDRATLFEGDAQKDKKHMIEMMKGGALKDSKYNEKNYFGPFRNRREASDRLFETPPQSPPNKHILEIQESTKTTTGKAKVMRSRYFLRVSLMVMESWVRSVYPSMKFPGPQEQLPRYLRIESPEIEFLEKIGSGGSADIHKCRWENYDYAVKIFHAGDVVSLRKEVQNLIELPRHTNIIDLVGFSILESDNRPMVVMELLNCDLFTLIRTGEYKVESKFQVKKFRLTALHNRRNHLSPFPTGVAIDFIYQVATGMSFLHRRQIFHGDLKALNVLVKRHRDGIQLKISDFGFSEKLVKNPNHNYGSDSDCSSFNSANAGTTRWMAPEVYGVDRFEVDGEIEPYSMKADVYSFAMTCVEILTREVPFPKISTRDVRKYVRGGGRPELPTTNDVPEDLRKLIAQCWDINPLQRPDFSEICTCLQELKKRFPLQI